MTRSDRDQFPGKIHAALIPDGWRTVSQIAGLVGGSKAAVYKRVISLMVDGKAERRPVKFQHARKSVYVYRQRVRG